MPCVAGLSDHVRCFHCNNGLRNWEAEDDPWVEHARWYPRCNFVLLSKGPEYIYQVRLSTCCVNVASSIKLFIPRVLL